MELGYWIIEDKLIFKPEFNEELDNYYNVIEQYNTLIFSEYDVPEITIETDNKYDHKYTENYKISKFNQEIELTENITHLSFGYCFNQKLELTNNVTNLTLCHNHKTINYLTNKVKNLTLKYFNKKITNLPNSIKTIKLFNCSKNIIKK